MFLFQSHMVIYNDVIMVRPVGLQKNIFMLFLLQELTWTKYVLFSVFSIKTEARESRAAPI